MITEKRLAGVMLLWIILLRITEKANVVKVDILINGEKVDAMSFICHQVRHTIGEKV
jgi:spore maturation protein SpmA